MTNTTQPPREPEKSGPRQNFADHIRNEFESLKRQNELAPELACFRAGGELARIDYFAHPHGLHVARWLKILSHTQASVCIDTANPVPAFSGPIVSARPLVPRFLKVPMSLRYLIAGLVARFRGSRSSVPVHAHCASGNGLIAWLSGRKYLIGTYGSEIFDAPRRGFLYCWLMKRILQGAERIADCSPECTRVLREQFGIPAERIYSFHLGYDESRFRPLSHQQRMQLRRDAGLPEDERIWVINRRTDPHYRTQEVVAGFLDYCRTNPSGRLVVLCGDHQPQYADRIAEMIASRPEGHRVVVIKQMLTPDEFAAWLQLSDYSVSVPRTDNFSIAILESMGCGTIPILSNLDGYGQLRECPPVRWMEGYDPNDFCEMFVATSATSSKELQADKNECFQYVRAGFSTEKALHDLAAFYLGTPLVKTISHRKAA